MVTLLIMVMVAGVVAAGVPMAGRVYKQVIESANAQLLLSTTMTALRNELETANDDGITCTPATEDTGAKVNYYSTTTLYTTIASSSGGIIFMPYESGSFEENESYSRELVSRATANMNLHTEFSSITYENGMFTIKGLVVKKGDTELAGSSLDDNIYYIRSLKAK